MKPVYSMMALTIAGIAVLYGASAAQSDRAFANVSVLRAQKIELVDARGVTRARFTTEENGEVVLRLIAANGELRVKLGGGNRRVGSAIGEQRDRARRARTREGSERDAQVEGGRKRARAGALRYAQATIFHPGS